MKSSLLWTFWILTTTNQFWPARLNLSLIRSSLRAGSRTARVFRVWEAIIQTTEPVVRYVVSLWPPVAAIVLAWITYTVITRSVAPQRAPVLLLLGLVILGSVVVLC